MVGLIPFRKDHPQITTITRIFRKMGFILRMNRRNLRIIFKSLLLGIEQHVSNDRRDDDRTTEERPL